jgi:hypothetical protein
MDHDTWLRHKDACLRELYQVTHDLGGKISGEHGIGLKRKKYLPAVTDPVELELMRAIKRAWDPHGIMNPGKIFDPASGMSAPTRRRRARRRVEPEATMAVADLRATCPSRRYCRGAARSSAPGRPTSTRRCASASARCWPAGALAASRVAVGVGSRGIRDLPLLVRTSSTRCGRPAATPSWSRAWAATVGRRAEGQVRLLAQARRHAGHGRRADPRRPWTSSRSGAPATPTAGSSTPTRRAADAIVFLNAIKPHVAFRGSHESGLMKMLAIGLGKQRGADLCHAHGFGRMAEVIVVAMGRVTLSRVQVPFAVGIVENAYAEIADLAVLPGAPRSRPRKWRCCAVRAPWRHACSSTQLDVLVVDEIGKDVSGTGMDTHVIGRYHTPFLSGGPTIARIAVLDLTGGRRATPTASVSPTSPPSACSASCASSTPT